MEAETRDSWFSRDSLGKHLPSKRGKCETGDAYIPVRGVYISFSHAKFWFYTLYILRSITRIARSWDDALAIDGRQTLLLRAMEHEYSDPTRKCPREPFHRFPLFQNQIKSAPRRQVLRGGYSVPLNGFLPLIRTLLWNRRRRSLSRHSRRGSFLGRRKWWYTVWPRLKAATASSSL